MTSTTFAPATITTQADGLLPGDAFTLASISYLVDRIEVVSVEGAFGLAGAQTLVRVSTYTEGDREVYFRPAEMITVSRWR